MSPSDEHAPGVGHVWLRVPADRTTMITTLENPVADTLTLTIAVNDAIQPIRIPPHRTIRVESPLRDGATQLAITFRGDRRVIITETDFR